MYLTKQLLFKITIRSKTEVFVFIDLEIESKKGEIRDSHGFSLEGKKSLIMKERSVFPRLWIISLSFGLIFIMNALNPNYKFELRALILKSFSPSKK